jgi:hypothetical protein
MRIFFLALVVLSLFAFTWGTQVAAQMQTPVTGSPTQMGGGKVYTPAVVVMNGTVTAVNRTIPQTPEQQVQVRFTLQTTRGPIPVRLGPAAFVDRQPVQVAVGDVVQVTGTIVSRGRRTILFAAQVKKGSQVLQLRNEQGQPLGGAAPSR